jgi:hypothetical protein
VYKYPYEDTPMMWLYNIDIKSLGDRTRILILQRLKERLGYVGTYRALGISDSSLSRYLRGVYLTR